jgi:hypothetical protein
MADAAALWCPCSDGLALGSASGKGGLGGSSGSQGGGPVLVVGQHWLGGERCLPMLAGLCGRVDGVEPEGAGRGLGAPSMVAGVR